MTTTAADLVSECERYLYSGAREPQNKLSGAISTTTATTVTFLYTLGQIQAGSVIAVDLEMMYVWSVTDATTMTVVVERGWEGSTAATHADAAIVYVNPKFSKFAILDAINADLNDLSAPSNGLFQPVEYTFTFHSAKYGYDLVGATDVLETLDARMETPGPAKDWPPLKGVDIKRESDLTDFPSGFSVILDNEAFPGRDVRITYAAPFTPFTALSQNIVSQTGLRATATDIPPLGAAMRLQSMREGQRNFNDSQGDSRRAEEVPVGAQLAGVRGPAGTRQARIAAERSRLRKIYPHRRRIYS